MVPQGGLTWIGFLAILNRTYVVTLNLISGSPRLLFDGWIIRGYMILEVISLILNMKYLVQLIDWSFVLFPIPRDSSFWLFHEEQRKFHWFFDIIGNSPDFDYFWEDERPKWQYIIDLPANFCYCSFPLYNYR